MDTAYADAEVEVRPDNWRRGRYRLELCSYPACGLDHLDAALRQMGYEVVDADQWGRSYRQSLDPNHRAELDEVDDGSGRLRLLLAYGDLDPADIEEGKEDLRRIGDQLALKLLCQYDESIGGTAVDYQDTGRWIWTRRIDD